MVIGRESSLNYKLMLITVIFSVISDHQPRTRIMVDTSCPQMLLEGRAVCGSAINQCFQAWFPHGWKSE